MDNYDNKAIKETSHNDNFIENVFAIKREIKTLVRNCRKCSRKLLKLSTYWEHVAEIVIVKGDLCDICINNTIFNYNNIYDLRTDMTDYDTIINNQNIINKYSLEDIECVKCNSLTLGNNNNIKITTNCINNRYIKINIVCQSCVKYCNCGSEIFSFYNEKCCICNVDCCIICNNQVSEFGHCNICNICEYCIPGNCIYGEIRICNYCSNNTNKINYLKILPKELINTILNELDIYEVINYAIATQTCDEKLFTKILESIKLKCWGCETLSIKLFSCFLCGELLCQNCIKKCDLCNNNIPYPKNSYACGEKYDSCRKPYSDVEYYYNIQITNYQYGFKFKCSKCGKQFCHSCYDMNSYDKMICKECK